jgi:hypothetical protein
MMGGIIPEPSKYLQTILNIHISYPRPAGGELNNNTGHHHEYIPTNS